MELPKPVAWLVKADYPFVDMNPPIEGGLPRDELFTADQMRAYGEQCALMERERCAAEIAKLKDAVEDWQRRWSVEALSGISGGYKDGRPVW